MDYSTQSTGAAEALADEGEGEMEDSAAEAKGSTFFLEPDAIPNGDALQPGATLTFVGRGEDGRLEFESAGEATPPAMTESEGVEKEMMAMKGM